MSKAYLYINSKGYPVTRHSHTAGADFDFCNMKYKLARIDGWARIEQSAAFEFGKCVEAGWQAYHQAGAEMSLETFIKGWAERKDMALSYTDKEVDWENCNIIGQEMLKLYCIKAPSFPFKNPRFQVMLSREVFPGTDYAGIDFIGYIDMLCDDLIVDCKTSASADPPEIIEAQGQLQEYAWLKKEPNVGYLWFGKSSRGITKGSTVTFLEDYQDFKAGQSVEVTGTKNKAPMVGDVAIPVDKVTKQVVKFVQARIQDEDIATAGARIEEQIVRIVNAERSGKFPKTADGLFEKKCDRCEMRGICWRPSLRDELVARKDSTFEFGE